MARTQSELFENATQIAELKIRKARAMQSREAKDILKIAVQALVARFRRSSATGTDNARQRGETPCGTA